MSSIFRFVAYSFDELPNGYSLLILLLVLFDGFELLWVYSFVLLPL